MKKRFKDSIFAYLGNLGLGIFWKWWTAKSIYLKNFIRYILIKFRINHKMMKKVMKNLNNNIHIG